MKEKERNNKAKECNAPFAAVSFSLMGRERREEARI